jgi:hypothetical protein
VIVRDATDSELIAGSNPFSDRSASFLEATDCQVDKLGCGLIRWKATACFGSFSDHPVQALNRVCHDNEFADDCCDGQFFALPGVSAVSIPLIFRLSSAVLPSGGMSTSSPGGQDELILR